MSISELSSQTSKFFEIKILQIKPGDLAELELKPTEQKNINYFQIKLYNRA
ncbi:hypothetical protein M565_ctg4P442 [Vibrio cyclitrophicus FF75]|nr:hypothetical protein M565_ctg4P442 [Vibrio cyclitrophicus FF75]